MEVGSGLGLEFGLGDESGVVEKETVRARAAGRVRAAGAIGGEVLTLQRHWVLCGQPLHGGAAGASCARMG